MLFSLLPARCFFWGAKSENNRYAPFPRHLHHPPTLVPSGEPVSKVVVINYSLTNALVRLARLGTAYGKASMTTLPPSITCMCRMMAQQAFGRGIIISVDLISPRLNVESHELAI